MGAVLPQPSLVPELCTSHNPGTQPPGARLPGCVAVPPLTRGTALRAAFLWAPQCWLPCACVSYRLDMNALASRRAQERAELINKYEQVLARVLGEEVGPCLKDCACESQTQPPWGHGGGGRWTFPQ